VPIGVPRSVEKRLGFLDGLKSSPFGLAVIVISAALARRGLLKQPESDAGLFTDPFSSDPSDRLYKTGDLVRYLPDGNLEFLASSINK